MFALIGLVGAAMLAGCSPGSGDPTPGPRDSLMLIPVPDSVRVDLRAVPGLGKILVDGGGRALYMFPPDASKRMSCTGSCAGVWPPLVIAAGHAPTAGPGVSAGLLGTIPDPNTGALAVTYNGHPLYRYSGDLSPGEANGQALYNSGGPWYVLNDAGQPIVADPGESS